MTTRQIWAGGTLAFGGALSMLVNGVLTPMLPIGLPFGEIAASSIFLLRLSLAAVVALSLIIGALGLRARHRHQSGWFGAVSFALAFMGSLMLFAHEWGQVFFIHHLALVAPDALDAMENVEGVNLFDLEAIVTLLAFTVGWLLFSTSMLIANTFGRIGPILVIAGMFAIPLLSAMISPVAGMALGNAILSSGWIVLGLELSRKTDGQS